MVGSPFVEVCGSIIFGLTRSVAEHYDPNSDEFDPESFGFHLLESTGLEWNSHPVDEFIFQEYGDREVRGSAVQRIIDASSTEDHDELPDEQENRAMEWKKFRPSKIRTLWYSMYFGFLISILAATLIGTFSIFVYYVAYQDILVCLTRSKESVPANIQWSITISVCIVIIFDHLWFFVNTLFFFRSYQIMGLKWKLFLVSFVFSVLDAAYRIALQALGISRSKLTPVQRIPGNILFSFSIGMQSWVLCRHFFRAVGPRKLTTFLWMIGSSALTFTVAILVSYFIYPAYNKQDKTGKIYIAVFAPLITVVLKGSSRICVQRLWRISHPGTSFLLLVPLYYGSAVSLRVLQVDLNTLKSVALIGIIHGIAEVIERSIVVLIDYINHQICERRRISWRSFRTPRLEIFASIRANFFRDRAKTGS